MTKYRAAHRIGLSDGTVLQQYDFLPDNVSEEEVEQLKLAHAVYEHEERPASDATEEGAGENPESSDEEVNTEDEDNDEQ